MKKFLKNIILFFGASFSLVDNSLHKFTENFSTVKEVLISAKTEKKVNIKTNLENNLSRPLEKEKIALNQTKLFLIVNTQMDTKEKSKKNTLLLVGAEDQLNTLSVNKKFIQELYLYNLSYTDSRKTPLQEKIEVLLMRLSNPKSINQLLVEQNIVRSPIDDGAFQKNHCIAQGLREISYTGYKYICPVFFQENFAKNFLIENTQDIKDIFKKNDKMKKGIFEEEFLNNIKSTKSKSTDNPSIKTLNNNIEIICIGLGDFIEYYSTTPNNKVLEKIEFLFFPDLEIMSKTRKKKICLKGFKAYQQQLYNSKNI